MYMEAGGIVERVFDLEKKNKKVGSTIYWSQANLLIFLSPIFLTTGNSNNNTFYLDSRLYELQSAIQQCVYLHYYRKLGKKKTPQITENPETKMKFGRD